MTLEIHDNNVQKQGQGQGQDNIRVGLGPWSVLEQVNVSVSVRTSSHVRLRTCMTNRGEED